MKKIISLLLTLMLAASLCACGGSDTPANSSSEEKGAEDASAEADGAADYSKVKIGFICLHDENSTYDLNFINGAKEACDKLGVEYVLKTNVPEGQECYETALGIALKKESG